jgi:hypothetical protein
MAIALKNFKHCRRHRSKILGHVADSAQKFARKCNVLPLQPTAHKIFYRRRQQHLKIFTNVGKSAKKFKMVISSLNHQSFEFFDLVFH